MSLRLLPFGSLVLVLAGCSASTPAPACAPEPQPALAASPANAELAKLHHEQLAARLMDVTMGANLGKQVMDAMIQNLRKLPNLPPGFIDRFQANAHVEDLRRIVLPIYVQIYDRETMIAALSFYESVQGQALVSKLPEATRLSMEAGQNWGREVAEKTLAEVGAT